MDAGTEGKSSGLSCPSCMEVSIDNWKQWIIITSLFFFCMEKYLNFIPIKFRKNFIINEKLQHGKVPINNPFRRVKKCPALFNQVLDKTSTLHVANTKSCLPNCITLQDKKYHGQVVPKTCFEMSQKILIEKSDAWTVLPID